MAHRSPEKPNSIIPILPTKMLHLLINQYTASHYLYISKAYRSQFNTLSPRSETKEKCIVFGISCAIEIHTNQGEI